MMMLDSVDPSDEEDLAELVALGRKSTAAIREVLGDANPLSTTERSCPWGASTRMCGIRPTPRCWPLAQAPAAKASTEARTTSSRATAGLWAGSVGSCSLRSRRFSSRLHCRPSMARSRAANRPARWMGLRR